MSQLVTCASCVFLSQLLRDRSNFSQPVATLLPRLNKAARQSAPSNIREALQRCRFPYLSRCDGTEIAFEAHKGIRAAFLGSLPFGFGRSNIASGIWPTDAANGLVRQHPSRRKAVDDLHQQVLAACARVKKGLDARRVGARRKIKCLAEDERRCAICAAPLRASAPTLASAQLFVERRMLSGLPPALIGQVECPTTGIAAAATAASTVGDSGSVPRSHCRRLEPTAQPRLSRASRHHQRVRYPWATKPANACAPRPKKVSSSSIRKIDISQWADARLR